MQCQTDKTYGSMKEFGEKRGQLKFSLDDKKMFNLKIIDFFFPFLLKSVL